MLTASVIPSPAFILMVTAFLFFFFIFYYGAFQYLYHLLVLDFVERLWVDYKACVNDEILVPLE